MTITTGISVTTLERAHRRAVDDLLFHSYQVHTHLDWYEPVDWLDQHPALVRLAWVNHRLAGLLALSQTLNRTSWLRIVALSDDSPANTVLGALWQDILPELRDLGVETVSALVMRQWVINYLRDLNFVFVEDVITLQRSSTLLPDQPDLPVRVRGLYPDDLPRLTAIDQAAFSAPWQMTQSEIRQASRIAELCTVADVNAEPVGFQISTLYRDGAHLARLAVDPNNQGHGIGSILLHDLLRRFMERDIMSVTVNTQASNLRSQRLYRTFGFRRNGYDLPVWMIRIRR
ncbi:MAG: GNAT family N-acetyltransferase [Anaerolineae bacterium]|nr:GNAT family N-acetyltransferase [Anaerolineae bacterium]